MKSASMLLNIAWSLTYQVHSMNIRIFAAFAAFTPMSSAQSYAIRLLTLHPLQRRVFLQESEDLCIPISLSRERSVNKMYEELRSRRRDRRIVEREWYISTCHVFELTRGGKLKSHLFFFAESRY
jgi:hypothetical protein